MPQKCSACSHADRKEIDAELAAGATFRNIAERHGLSPTAVFRHKEHVLGALGRAKAKRKAGELANAEQLLGELHASKDKVLAALKQIEELTGTERLACLPALLACVREHCRIGALLMAAEAARAPEIPIDGPLLDHLTPAQAAMVGALHRKARGSTLEDGDRLLLQVADGGIKGYVGFSPDDWQDLPEIPPAIAPPPVRDPVPVAELAATTPEPIPEPAIPFVPPPPDPEPEPERPAPRRHLEDSKSFRDWKW